MKGRFQYPILYAVVAFTLLGVSFPLGLSATYDAGKQTGYVFTFNWSLGLGVLAPLCLHFLLSAVRQIRALPDELVASGMIVEHRDRALRPAGEGAADALRESGNKSWSGYRYVLLLLYCLGALFALYFWLDRSAIPLWEGRESAGPFALHADEGAWMRVGNGAFTLVVSLLLMSLLWMIAFYVVAVLALVEYTKELVCEGVLVESGEEPRRLFLIPQLSREQSGARRAPGGRTAGFRVFGELFTDLWLALLALLSMAYLARLWSYYRNASGAETVWAFVTRELPVAFLDVEAGDLTSALVIFGVAIGIAFSVLIPLNELRKLRTHLRERLPATPIGALSRDQVSARVDKLDIWPVRIPSAMVFLLLVLLIFLSLIFCWLALVNVAVVVALLVARPLARWLRAREPSPPSPAPEPIVTIVDSEPNLATASTSIKMLYLAANPSSTSRQALGEEVSKIEDQLRKAAHGAAFELKTKWAVRPGDLLDALLLERPTIVHFSGQGFGESGLVLHGDEGEAQTLVRTDTFAKLFHLIKDNIRVIVLNACHSEEQALALVEEIDFVVGMKGALTDEDARKFTAAFYLGLGYGRTVQTAFDLGVVTLGVDRPDGADCVPVLLARAGVDPGRVVLVECQEGEPAVG